jgi:protein SCO1/2
MRFTLRATAALILLATLITGCKQSSQATQSSAASTALSAASDGKTYAIRGRVVSVDVVKGMVMLDGEAIPGFMDAMTMPYKLKDFSVAVKLRAGDHITATLVVRQGIGGDEEMLLDQVVVIAPTRADVQQDTKPVEAHIPAVGDLVPDFRLTNQDGRAIHLGQFKGRVLLLTFVYTRCPLPDYCIRMSRNFAQIDRVLVSDPTLYAQTHLLSISFDPKVDTPAVLKRYGESYVGSESPQAFAHWDFSVPPVTEVGRITHYFDVGLTPSDGGLFTHTMSTVLVGKDGRIRAWYPTNKWTVAEVLAAIKSAAAA